MAIVFRASEPRTENSQQVYIIYVIVRIVPMLQIQLIVKCLCLNIKFNWPM